MDFCWKFHFIESFYGCAIKWYYLVILGFDTFVEEDMV